MLWWQLCSLLVHTIAVLFSERFVCPYFMSFKFSCPFIFKTFPIHLLTVLLRVQKPCTLKVGVLNWLYLHEFASSWCLKHWKDHKYGCQVWLLCDSHTLELKNAPKNNFLTLYLWYLLLSWGHKREYIPTHTEYDNTLMRPTCQSPSVQCVKPCISSGCIQICD